jgi:hypothetical protein
MKMFELEEVPQFYQQINNQFKKEIHNLENVEHVNHYTISNINLGESDETLIRAGKKRWKSPKFYGACICNPIGGLLELGYKLVGLHIQDNNSCDYLKLQRNLLVIVFSSCIRTLNLHH